uniref:Uncharacterized protein n=1 Tax=Strigamia maritima TaxID=126957 RepID=T1IPK4_STRMM
MSKLTQLNSQKKEENSRHHLHISFIALRISRSLLSNGMNFEFCWGLLWIL